MVTFAAFEVAKPSASHLKTQFPSPPLCREACFQVFLLIVMVGNLAEKSLALAATVIATLRATAL